jgi:hypothetical protein
VETTPYIGALNTKVQIYRMDKVIGPGGARTETPVLVCDTYASVSDDSGTEIVNEKITHVARAVYTIRKRAGLLVNEKLQLQDGDTKYNVEHVRKINRTHLALKCTVYE